MKQIKVAPSVMCANIQNLLDDIVKLEAAGADLFHFDIMDGHFVPNLTFGPHIVRGLRSATNLPFCAHLMVTRPDHFIPIFVDTGCQIIEVHAESEGELVRSLRLIRSLGSSPAVAINPATPVEVISAGNGKGWYYVDLTNTEMTCDVAVFELTGTGAKATHALLLPVDTGDIKVDVDAIDGDATAAQQLRRWASAGLKIGTADSGTTTTLVDAALTTGDGSYVPSTIGFGSGGSALNERLTRLITAFDAATDTLTFTPALPAAITTELYYIVPSSQADVGAWLGTVVPAPATAGIPQVNTKQVNDATVTGDGNATPWDGA